MNLEKLKTVFEKYEKFRLRQAYKLIFIDLIDDWDQASVFPLQMREELNHLFSLEIKSDLFLSKDKKSAKALLLLGDSRSIETSLMRHRDERNTICLSTQIGCPMACKFCASGKLKFKRNLSKDEIILQALFWARFLKQKQSKIDNIVFMGVGEPMLNYKNVLASILVFHDKDLFNISARKISISSIGVLDSILQLSKENLPINLAISLHASSDDTRKRLMPYAKNYKISQLMEAIDIYIKKTNRKVMLEYLLIKGINDSEKDAMNLIKLLSGRKLCYVNLIQYNQTGDFEASHKDAVRKFKNTLLRSGVLVTERHRFNADVFGACGQLIAN